MKNRFALLLLLPLFCFAETIDLSRYSKKQEKAGEAVHSFGFEAGEKYTLNKANGIFVESRAGMNGTAGLVISRSDAGRYDIAQLALPKLEGGKTYTLTLSAKAEGMKKNGKVFQGTIGFFAVEFYRKGKYAGGEYGGGANQNKWKSYQINFTVPNGATAQLSFYLAKGLTGKVAVDDITIRTQGIPPSILIVSPKYLTFRNGVADYEVLVDSEIPEKDVKVYVSVTRNGKTVAQFAVRGKDGLYRGSFGKIEPGKVTFSLKLLDFRNKQIVAEENFAFHSRPAETPPANAALLDKAGRLIVDGKPFMPLGVYGLSAKTDKINYREIKEAGFNSVMLYVPEEKLGLDEAQKAGLKLIYSICSRWHDHQRAEAARLVKVNKDHPALLAWYISDEVSRENVPRVLKLREAVSSIDPWHPTWTLTYRKQDFPYYGISGDIIGVDPYPITVSGENQDIRLVADYMENANTTKLPCWIVPQIFSWNSYHNCNAEALRKTRYATAEEIRSMPLLAAIYGARGFLFYSYFDLRKVDQFLPGSFEREWDKVKKMVAVMKELEPFILSTAKAPAVTVKSEPAGSVHAAAMCDEKGNLRIIVVGVGGKTRAAITVDDKRPLRSKFGLTKRLSDGRYEFLADKVNSDILY